MNANFIQNYRTVLNKFTFIDDMMVILKTTGLHFSALFELLNKHSFTDTIPANLIILLPLSVLLCCLEFTLLSSTSAYK